MNLMSREEEPVVSNYIRADLSSERISYWWLIPTATVLPISMGAMVDGPRVFAFPLQRLGLAVDAQNPSHQQAITSIALVFTLVTAVILANRAWVDIIKGLALYIVAFTFWGGQFLSQYGHFALDGGGEYGLAGFIGIGTAVFIGVPGLAVLRLLVNAYKEQFKSKDFQGEVEKRSSFAAMMESPFANISTWNEDQSSSRERLR